jgi:hypothetical protein
VKLTIRIALLTIQADNFQDINTLGFGIMSIKFDNKSFKETISSLTVTQQQQAKHFVAEACMTCVAPVYGEAKTCHLAQKVAMYCRMARTCSNMNHEEENPDFSKAEEATKKSIEEQYAILQDFLEEKS